MRAETLVEGGPRSSACVSIGSSALRPAGERSRPGRDGDMRRGRSRAAPGDRAPRPGVAAAREAEDAIGLLEAEVGPRDPARRATPADEQRRRRCASSARSSTGPNAASGARPPSGRGATRCRRASRRRRSARAPRRAAPRCRDAGIPSLSGSSATVLGRGRAVSSAPRLARSCAASDAAQRRARARAPRRAARSNGSRSIAIRSLSRAARTDAERGEPVSSASSPSAAPRPSTRSTAAVGRLADDLEAAGAHDEEAVGVVALAEQPLAGREADRPRAAPRAARAALAGRPGEHRDLGEEVGGRLGALRRSARRRAWRAMRAPAAASAQRSAGRRGRASRSRAACASDGVSVPPATAPPRPTEEQAARRDDEEGQRGERPRVVERGRRLGRRRRRR